MDPAKVPVAGKGKKRDPSLFDLYQLGRRARVLRCATCFCLPMTLSLGADPLGDRRRVRRRYRAKEDLSTRRLR